MVDEIFFSNIDKSLFSGTIKKGLFLGGKMMTADVAAAPRERSKKALFAIWHLIGRKSIFQAKDMERAFTEQAARKKVDLSVFVESTTAYSSMETLLTVIRRSMVKFGLIKHEPYSPYEIEPAIVAELKAMTEINPLLIGAEPVEVDEEKPIVSSTSDEGGAPIEPAAASVSSGDDEGAEPESELDVDDDEPYQVDSLEAAVVLFCSPGMSRWVLADNGGSKQWKLRLRNEFPAASTFIEVLLSCGILIKIGLKEAEQVYQIQPDMIEQLVKRDRLEAWAWEQFQAERATPPEDGAEELGIPPLAAFDEAIRKAIRMRDESRAEISKHPTPQACNQKIAELKQQIEDLERECKLVDALEMRNVAIESLPRLFRQGRRQVLARLREQEQKVLAELNDNLIFGARRLNRSPAELLLLLSHNLTCNSSEAKV